MRNFSAIITFIHTAMNCVVISALEVTHVRFYEHANYALQCHRLESRVISSTNSAIKNHFNLFPLSLIRISLLRFSGDKLILLICVALLKYNRMSMLTPTSLNRSRSVISIRHACAVVLRVVSIS